MKRQPAVLQSGRTNDTVSSIVSYGIDFIGLPIINAHIVFHQLRVVDDGGYWSRKPVVCLARYQRAIEHALSVR